MDDPLAKLLGIGGWGWEWQAVVRLVLAAVLGAAIGVEREHRGRAAGFRTLLLVSLGSALAMLVSVHFGNVYGAGRSEGIRVDPARLAYGVMAGIGFLGAGVILRHGTGIRGLTTAASLWCTAAIGLACGFGMFTIALLATGLVVVTLLGLFHLDRLIPSQSVKFLSLTLPLEGACGAKRFGDWIHARGARVIDVQVERNLSAGTETLTYEISLPARIPAASLMEMAKEAPGISRISIR